MKDIIIIGDYIICILCVYFFVFGEGHWTKIFAYFCFFSLEGKKKSSPPSPPCPVECV